MSFDPVTALLVGGGLFGAKKGLDALGNLGKTPNIEIPKPPVIDDARGNRDEFDRIRRRRGVLANVFSRGDQSPTVAQKQLLGN